MKRVVMFVVAASLLAVQAQQAQATVACCRINANGTINSNGTFRCNFSSTETRRLSTGNYEVDFTPASNDVRFYAKSATLDTQTTGSTTGQIGVSDRSGDFSSVFVRTTNSAGGQQDLAFDLCLH